MKLESPEKSGKSPYSRALRTLEKFESNPGYSRQKGEKSHSPKTLTALKKCFELMVSRKHNNLSTEGLDELLVEGFDDEQIWQQIELKNKNFSSYVPEITDFILEKDLRFPCLTDQEIPRVETGGSTLEPAEDNFEESIVSDESMSGDEDEQEVGEDMEEGEDESAEDEEDIGEEPEVEREIPRKNKKPRTVVDDQFFNLREMGKFLDEAEKEDYGANNNIDYFEDIPSDEEEDVKSAKYDDFFRDPGSDGEQAGEEEMDEDFDQDDESGESEVETRNKGKGDKKVRFSLLDGSESEKDSENEEEKTTFQRREEKLRQKIAKLEESNLSEKPWKYKGEVKLNDRPANSLLEEVLETDLMVRPAPVITEKVTNTLEQIILNRIKDSAYDDVERKIKPVKIPHELKKDLVLNQEKSKYSLAEVYEQEFLKRKPTEEVAEDPNKLTPEKEEILKKMKLVFHKLNVLSNFHYTPKPVTADIEIVSKKPALTMEEVTPAAVSDANLLAPQEVGGEIAKKQLIGKDERSDSQRRQERRKKKAFQSKKFKKEQNTQAAKVSKVLKSRNVELMKSIGDGTNIKSSSSFFNKLQENTEVSKKVKTKKVKN